MTFLPNVHPTEATLYCTIQHPFDNLDGQEQGSGVISIRTAAAKPHAAQLTRLHPTQTTERCPEGAQKLGTSARAQETVSEAVSAAQSSRDGGHLSNHAATHFQLLSESMSDCVVSAAAMDAAR